MVREDPHVTQLVRDHRTQVGVIQLGKKASSNDITKPRRSLCFGSTETSSGLLSTTDTMTSDGIDRRPLSSSTINCT